MLPNGEILSIPRGKCFASPGGEFTIFDSKGKDMSLKLPSYRIPCTKNTCGVFTAPQMDLIDLFIGSEGCFGVITEVVVALLERTEKISIVQFLKSDEQAIDLVDALRNEKGIQIEAHGVEQRWDPLAGHHREPLEAIGICARGDHATRMGLDNEEVQRTAAREPSTGETARTWGEAVEDAVGLPGP